MYSEVTQQDVDELNEICQLSKTVSLGRTKESTTYFAFQSLGLKPRRWQHVFWKALDYGTRRLLTVTSRQIGKSTAIATFALKSTAYNMRPAGITKKTHVGIISATDEQSKKIMLEIRRLIQLGDENVSRVTGGKIHKFYTHLIDDSREAANNMTTITFKNGNTIVCLPPTPRIRGYSFSYVFVDEAAFIEDENVFFQYIEPTTANTDGVIVMTTTPNGMQGWFYDLFDPENKRENQYNKLWFHYTIMKEEAPEFIKDMEAKRRFYMETGREREFQQEYDALFTSQMSAFFEAEDVEKGVNPEMIKCTQYAGECDMGIDFGMVHSKTVITINAFDAGIIKLLYDYEYKEDDATLLNDIKELKQHFPNMQRIIVDDCPEAHYIIPEISKIGVPLTLMSFRTDKLKKYLAFRRMLKKGKVQYYKNAEMIAQMKALQQIETATTTKIQKPSGGRDDYPDSLILSSYHFVEEEEDFSTEVVYSPSIKGTATDQQWEKMQEFYRSDEFKLWNEVLK